MRRSRASQRGAGRTIEVVDLDPAVKHCLQQLWPGVDLEIAPVTASGWSGMPIWKVVAHGESITFLASFCGSCDEPGAYSVRGWPPCNESLSKIQYWSEAVDCYRYSIESCPFPAPIPWAWGPRDRYTVMGETLYWTLAPWRRGASLQQHQVDQAQRLLLVQWLASIHSTTQQIGKRVDASKSLLERWNQFSSLASRFSIDNFALQLQKIGRAQDQASACEQARLFQERLQLLNRQFRMHCGGLTSRSHALHWIVRDLWRENVLLDGQGSLSVVDLGAARVEWPMFDLVRLLGSLRTSEAEWSECILAYFRERGSEPTYSSHSLRLIHGISTALSIAYWLDRTDYLLSRSNTSPTDAGYVLSSDSNASAKSLNRRVSQRLEDLFWEWDQFE